MTALITLSPISQALHAPDFGTDLYVSLPVLDHVRFCLIRNCWFFSDVLSRAILMPLWIFPILISYPFPINIHAPP